MVILNPLTSNIGSKETNKEMLNLSFSKVFRRDTLVKVVKENYDNFVSLISESFTETINRKIFLDQLRLGDVKSFFEKKLKEKL